MEYITTKEASAKWRISPTRITILANEGRIPGAQRLGKSWLIPATATKPEKLKANHTRTKKIETETNSFSFPLYHFRPDWSYIKENQSLSIQQQSLLQAETAVMECRFEDAYEMLESILTAPEDINTEIGGLWNACICCIALNKPNDFPRIYLRLHILLSKDLPHRDDLAIVLDCLNTYTETLSSVANSDGYNTNIHYQCLPLACLLAGYTQLTKEAIKPGSSDLLTLELLLRFVQTTSSVITVEMLHMHLLTIYSLRQNTDKAEYHAKNALQIAYENKLYFPLITYYLYSAQILSPIMEQYPENFRNHINKLLVQYKTNLTAFFNTLNENSVTSKLEDADYPYISAVLLGLTNTAIAEKLGIHPQTVKRRLSKLCKKLGVSNKKELKIYLHNYM